GRADSLADRLPSMEVNDSPGNDKYAALEKGIVGEDELLALLGEARARGERVVMTNGCFDILHVGHVSYLTEARSLGDRLIVAVNADASVRRLKGADRPINGLRPRMMVLAALACVDWVVPFSEDTPERLICRLLPDVLVKGGDYRPEDIAGGRCVIENGGEVQVLQFVDGCSTTALIESFKTVK
ncbi:MAG: D-glycero-beta-D-manno-heptose 1-phosphate adenylyltransferase, partial [Thiohalomonadaceae bacterium]